jgi:hypothetical protein
VAVEVREIGRDEHVALIPDDMESTKLTEVPGIFSTGVCAREKVDAVPLYVGPGIAAERSVVEHSQTLPTDLMADRSQDPVDPDRGTSVVARVHA